MREKRQTFTGTSQRMLVWLCARSIRHDQKKNKSTFISQCLLGRWPLVPITESLLFSCLLWSAVSEQWQEYALRYVCSMKHMYATHSVTQPQKHTSQSVLVQRFALESDFAFYCSYCHLLRHKAQKLGSHSHSSPAQEISLPGAKVLLNWMKVKWFFQHTFWSFCNASKVK